MPDEAPAAPAVVLSPVVTQDPEGGWQLKVTVTNGLAETIHILQAPRMPYRTVEQGEVVIRWSLRPAPEGMASGWLDTPSSRTVAAGASAELTARLPWPMTLEDHYLRARPHPGVLSAPVRARVELGTVSEALTEARASGLSLQALLAEQTVVQGASFALPEVTP